jgi:hypothetical protein
MTAPTNNNPSVLFSAGPFPHEDIAQVGFQSLTLVDAGRFSQVCKAWNAAMQSPGIWLTLFDVEKIPRIKGRVATAQEDLRFMLPRTCSAKQMAPLGRFVGVVPLVNPVVFEIFRTIVDPYDSTGKMSETWVFVVEPESIYRDDVDEDLLKALKTEGDFDTDAEIDDLKKQGVLIPYSLKNLKVCADHPVTNKGTKVFGYFNADVLQQCSTISKAVRVTLMRKEVPESTRNKTWPQQIDELAENGHVPVKLSTRGFYNATNILNKGTCPDNYDGSRYTFSRTSDEVKAGNDVRPSAIGGFALGAGVSVYAFFDPAYDYYGAAPGVPEEVLRPLDIGTLAIGSGH